MRTIMRPSVVLLAAALVGVLGLTAAGANVGGTDNFLAATVTPTAAPERLAVSEPAGAGTEMADAMPGELLVGFAPSPAGSPKQAARALAGAGLARELL